MSQEHVSDFVLYLYLKICLLIPCGACGVRVWSGGFALCAVILEDYFWK